MWNLRSLLPRPGEGTKEGSHPKEASQIELNPAFSFPTADGTAQMWPFCELETVCATRNPAPLAAVGSSVAICTAVVGPQSPLSLPSLIQAAGVKVRLDIAGYNLALSSSSADAWPDLKFQKGCVPVLTHPARCVKYTVFSQWASHCSSCLLVWFVWNSVRINQCEHFCS